MKPMLARTYGPKFSRFPCFCQPKLNGIRALYQTGNFQSRDEKFWKGRVLGHLVDALAPYEAILKGVILDGELYRHSTRLQDINSAIAVNRLEPTEATPSIEYHVFDIVDPNKLFSHRWFDFYSAIQLAKIPGVVAVPTALVHDRGELDQHFHYYTSLGYEGIMLRPDGPYEFGETAHGTQKRSEFLWKHKQWEDGEFECIGVTQGEGKADIGIGALICRTQKNGHALEFKVGTGFSDADRILYASNPPIGRLVRVRYLELTADGIPFNPSFLAVL